MIGDPLPLLVLIAIENSSGRELQNDILPSTSQQLAANNKIQMLPQDAFEAYIEDIWT